MKKFTLRAGGLRHRVDIKQEDGAVDGMGGSTHVATTIASSIPALVLSAGGSESYSRVRVEATATHLVLMRYRSDLTAASWLVYEGRRLDVVRFSDLDCRKTALLVQCKESK